jgi:hypothetical protein
MQFINDRWRECSILLIFFSWSLIVSIILRFGNRSLLKALSTRGFIFFLRVVINSTSLRASNSVSFFDKAGWDDDYLLQIILSGQLVSNSKD